MRLLEVGLTEWSETASCRSRVEDSLLGCYDSTKGWFRDTLSGPQNPKLWLVLDLFPTLVRSPHRHGPPGRAAAARRDRRGGRAAPRRRPAPRVGAAQHARSARPRGARAERRTAGRACAQCPAAAAGGGVSRRVVGGSEPRPRRGHRTLAPRRRSARASTTVITIS